MFRFYNVREVGLIDKLIGRQATIQLSSAFNLNDPYELKFNLRIDPLASRSEQEFYKNRLSSNKQDFLEWQKHVLEHDGYTWYIEQKIRNDIAQQIKLCSFTESKDSNLMWSHYANNHRGICIEYQHQLFNFLETSKGFLAYGIVKYSSKPPVINNLDTPEDILLKAIFNKQSEWKYEKEHRVVFISDNETDYVSIDKSHIKTVYIGSKASNEVKDEILSICKDSSIDVYYGVTLGKTYKVNFRKHKEGTSFPKAFWR